MIDMLIEFFIGVGVGYLLGRFKAFGYFLELPGYKDWDRKSEQNSYSGSTDKKS